MPTVPAGTLSLALQLARATLADCDSFRGLKSPAMDQATALAHIYYEGLDPPSGDVYTVAELEGYRPFALVYINPNHGFRREVSGVSGTTFDWEDAGKIIISIEKDASATNGYEPTNDAGLEFLNQIGGIMDDLASLAGGEDYLGVRAISLLLGPYSVGEDDAVDEGVWQSAHLELEYVGVPG